MKKIGTSSLLLLVLLLTSCFSSGHGVSRNNQISSLFQQADQSLNAGNEISANNAGSVSGAGVTDYPKYENIDIDLTTMNATMVYSEVNDMLSYPSSYINKIVKMQGPFLPFESNDPNYCYPAILIRDATACCASGIEFLLYGVPRCSIEGGNGYPLYNEEATIVGRFETYLEGTDMYVHLVDAIWLESLN